MIFHLNENIRHDEFQIKKNEWMIKDAKAIDKHINESLWDIKQKLLRNFKTCRQIISHFSFDPIQI